MKKHKNLISKTWNLKHFLKVWQHQKLAQKCREDLTFDIDLTLFSSSS